MPSSARPKKPPPLALDRAGRTPEQAATRHARRARVKGAASKVAGTAPVKASRSFLPFVIAAGLLTLFGQVIKSKGKKVAWTKTVVGAVVLLFFLTLLNEASAQLATAFAVLILIRAILLHGPTVFGALTPK